MQAKQRAMRTGVFLAAALAVITSRAAPVPPTSAPAAPLPPTPGQVQSSLPIAPPAPELKSSPLVNTPPPITGEVASGGPTVTVTAFEVTGNTVFSSDLLLAQVASYLGKDLTLAGLYQAAADLTRFYQSHGYGLARVTLPEQQLSSGRVILQVIEGRIGNISVENDARTRPGVILGQGAAVRSGDIYSDAALERASLLVNDLPALQAQAVLQPGSVFGTADLVYKVTAEPLTSGQISVDDYGRADVGRVRVNAEVNLASPTGSGDRFTADLTHTEHDQLDFAGLSYSLPLGPAGGRFNASYNQSRYYVTGAFSALGLHGSSRNGNLSYQYPLLRSRESSFYWGLGFQHAGGDTSATITAPVADPKTGLGVIDPVTGKKEFKTTTTRLATTNLNLGQLTAFYVRNYDDGSNYTLSGSLSSNGRHDDGNDPSGERALLELNAGYLQPFAQLWSLSARSSMAWSPDPLSDTEKYSLGGPENLRAFPSADARGDAGLSGSLELQRSFAPSWPLALGGFFEAGRAWNRHFDTPVTGIDPRTGKKVSGVNVTHPSVRTLTDVGAELIFTSADRRWESRLEWAFAVGDAKPSDGNNGGHIWLTFGMNF